MKRLLLILCSIFLVLGISGMANASSINIAEGASVSLTGSFFTPYTNAWPGGSPSSPALINSIVDGLFLPERTQWNIGTLWWDTHYPTDSDAAQSPPPRVWIDLGQEYLIDSFIVQADNNDSYGIFYKDSGSASWINILSIAGWGMMTRPEYVLTNTIRTSGLMIQATGGDGYYSLSEVQAFGKAAPVPEPTTMLLLGSGLVGLIGYRRKFKK